MTNRNCWIVSCITLILGALILYPEKAVRADAEQELVNYWAIEYVKKDPKDWSEAAQKVWQDKQDYDRKLFREGKIFMAGLFKPGGEPNDWIVFLQPMKRSEAEKIMQDDPSYKAGYAKAELRIFVTLIPGPGQTTKWDYPEGIGKQIESARKHSEHEPPQSPAAKP